MTMTEPKPGTSTAKSSGTASRWGTGTQTGGTASSTTNINAPGQVTVPGFGTLGQKTSWTGPGSSYRSVVAEYGDFAGASSSEINGILEAMIYKKDPRVKSLMKQLGVSKVGDLRKIWKRAATIASSIAKTGESVDFFEILSSPTTYETKAVGQAEQRYVANYFTSKGKPTAAANVLLRDTLTKVLGRVPSEEEIAEYRPLLDEMRKQQQAGLFTTRVNNKTGVTTPGLDPERWLAEQVTKKRQARVQYGKEKAQVSNQNSYLNLASEYGYNPYNPDGTLSEAARIALSKIEAGKMSLEDAQEQFKQAALAQYGYLKPQFDAGLTLRQIADPAISAIANILERDPTSITLNDPTVQKYLYGMDGKGTMPMYKYESLLKQDPSWQFTKNARSQFADLAAFIGNKFGINV